VTEKRNEGRTMCKNWEIATAMYFDRGRGMVYQGGGNGRAKK